ncbi:unnamed protein product [Rhizophagus irregularis]|nr:unnamed protein product [Rhizophagus irregularis]CAB5393482.1 unnamed protein product [Rhizophagus irregularis]
MLKLFGIPKAETPVKHLQLKTKWCTGANPKEIVILGIKLAIAIIGGIFNEEFGTFSTRFGTILLQFHLADKEVSLLLNRLE